MERQAFALLHEMENSWWYRGRASVVRDILSRGPASNGQVLDFGAGFGGMHVELSARGTVHAFEPDKEAQEVVAKKPYATVYSDPDSALAREYDLIGLFDVLEHIEDDAGFLEKARKALTIKGKLAITVPAMPFLWSNHDVSHHHFRRYTKRSLKKVLLDAGFVIDYMSYWNMVLFAPAALARIMNKSGEGRSFALPRFIDSIFYSIVQSEVALMRHMPLPFGVSLIALVSKKPS